MPFYAVIRAKLKSHMGCPVTSVCWCIPTLIAKDATRNVAQIFALGWMYGPKPVPFDPGSLQLQGASGRGRTQMLRNEMGWLWSPWACSLMGALEYAL